MNLITKYMTNNDCYKAGRKITPKGIMIHSTATPGVMAADWFNRWNKPGVDTCVHAFVDDKGVYQYLPWNHRGWHCGDSGNNTHISIEICEPKSLNDKGYFEKAWANAVELTAILCKQYGLSADTVIGHYEGHKKGIASNHADPGHWFPKHGKSMDTFRNDVKNNKGDVIVALRRGDKGELVKKLQENLNKLGAKLELDGSFGPATESAVKAFQTKYKLEVDGIAGPKTQAKIAELLTPKPELDYKALYEAAVKENNNLKVQNQTLQEKINKAQEVLK